MKSNLQIESVVAKPWTINYGFIDGKHEIKEKQIVVKKLQPINNNHGGFIKYHKKLYDIVENRQPIADITEVFGKVVETVISPKDGVLWSTSLYPMAFSGSTIALIDVDMAYI